MMQNDRSLDKQCANDKIPGSTEHSINPGLYFVFSSFSCRVFFSHFITDRPPRL